VKTPVLASALGLLCLACGHIQAYNAELAAAEEAAARRPKPAPQLEEPSRQLHVRAYADADYRAEHANWRASIAEVLEVTNLLVGPQLDATLRFDGAREWERECDLNDRDTCIAELERLDAGAADVWVVAFTSALPQLSRDLDTLGHSQPLGRHILLRGMSKLDETDDFDRDVSQLRSSERRALAEERRRHKAAIALMHAWAHSLGSLHGGDQVNVMHPSYGPEQAAFGDDATELLGFMLDARLSGSPETAEPLRAAYRVWLEEHPGSFTAEERQRRIAELSGTAPDQVLD
jgi:hypothetical protein